MATGGLVESFLINSALSLGLNLLGSWISPKRTEAIREDIPALGVNQPLYMCWGSTFTPSYLLYAVPANKAGHGDDRSSYGLLLFSNPDSTSELEALRVNGIIVSSKTSLFNLNAPENVIPGASKYSNSYGLTTYNNFNYEYQMPFNLANPDFAKLGQAGLQYQGLSWLRVIASERKIFGGFNTRAVAYVKNKITSSTAVTFDVNGNAPVRVISHFGRQGWFTIQWSDYTFDYPSGFYGTRVFPFFEGKNSNGYGLIGIGGGVEYVVSTSIFEINYVKYTIVGSVSPGSAPIAPGNYSDSPLSISGLINYGTVNSVLIGRDQQEITSVSLSTPGLAPLYGENGVIKDANDIVVYNAPPGTLVWGWANKMGNNTGSDPFNPINTSSLTTRSSPSSGSLTLGFTNLSTILTDLLVSKGIEASQIQFTNFTEVEVRGFTCTDDNVKQIIINLCTAYGKIVDDGFSTSLVNASYIFSDYPDGTNAVSIGLEQFINEPIIEYLEEANQPKQVEFSYRDWQNEYSERVITVGYGSPFPNTSSQKIDLVLTQKEAKKIAWNIYFLQGHTNMACRLHVDNISGIRSGSVLLVENPGSSPIKLIVGNIEIGADGTYLINCANFVPIYDLQYSLVTGNKYTDYMLEDVSAVVVNPEVVDSFRQIYMVEPVGLTSNAYGLLYTTDSANYSSYTDDGNLTPLNTISPGIYGFKGYVTAVNSRYSGAGYNIEYGLDSIEITRESGNNNTLPNSGLVRIDLGWFSYTNKTVLPNGNDLITGVRSGLYGSNTTIDPGSTVVELNLNNKVLGWNASTSVLTTPKTIQGVTSSSTYFVQPSVTDTTGITVGEQTSLLPYGAPAAGLVVGNLISSYDNGRLRIWFTNPGSIENSDFFLFPASSSLDIPYKDFWVKPAGVSQIFIGNINPRLTGYFEMAINLPVGFYKIYQGGSVGLNNPGGSYQFAGRSRD
jgi:hypothetical protein